MTSQLQSSLRRHILAFVGGLILLSMLGSTVSLYRITEVNSVLDAINRVSVPLGRLFGQMQSDGEILSRELERGLGYSHWKDEHWKPRPIPRWIQDVLQAEVGRVRELTRTGGEWASADAKARWSDWAESVNSQFVNLMSEADRLYQALEKHDEQTALTIYPHWNESMQDWQRQVQWGATEYDRQMRESFALAQSRVAELRTALELILGVVVLLSLLTLWLGERALRPLAELTKLARAITRRGLRREDKAAFPEIPLTRTDEVSQLAREFHRMATALLEREKSGGDSKRSASGSEPLAARDGLAERKRSQQHRLDSARHGSSGPDHAGQPGRASLAWSGRRPSREPKEVVGTLMGAWARLRPFIQKKPSATFRTPRRSHP